MKSIDNIMSCPECGISWDGGDINDEMRKKYPDVVEAIVKEWISSYGWTEENKYRFKENVIGVEDPEVYDGVSWWECLGCHAKWDRFTGEKIVGFSGVQG